MEHDGAAIRIDIETAGSVDAAVIHSADQDAAVGVGAVDGAGEGVLDVVVVAGIAVRAVEQHVVAVSDLIEGRGLDDAIVGAPLIIENRPGAIQERQRVPRHPLDFNGRRLVCPGRRASLACRRATEAVAVDFPEDPPIGAVVVPGGINYAPIGGVADQRLRLRRERA